MTWQRQASNLFIMKKLFFFPLPALAVFVCAFVIITSCNKREVFPSDEIAVPKSLASSRAGDPSVLNGMLHFASFSDFEDFQELLRLQELNTQNVKEAYTFLGVNVDAPVLPNVTDHPCCLKRELEFPAFASARKLEEQQINSALDAGTDIFAIIADPYLKTALNVDKAVHIGSRIFKYYENGGIMIVLNNDWSAFEAIKNLPYSELRQNGNIIVTSDAKDCWNYYYQIGADGAVLAEKVVSYPDHNAASPVCVFDDYVMVTTLNDGQIRFEVLAPYASTSQGQWFEWSFSDGQKATGNPVTKSFTNDGTVYIKKLNTGGGLDCRATVPYKVNCGEKKTVTRQLLRTIGTETWRIQGSIWVKSGEVGCTMKYLRKFKLGWFAASNDGVFMDLLGTYKRTTPTVSCADIAVNSSKGLGKGTYPTSLTLTKADPMTINREPNKLSAGQMINVSGTWFGFGVGSVPRLILD